MPQGRTVINPDILGKGTKAELSGMVPVQNEDHGSDNE
jgi:hypothetical protein